MAGYSGNGLGQRIMSRGGCRTKTTGVHSNSLGRMERGRRGRGRSSALRPFW